jgi:serine/threonine-protein kinase
MNRPDRAQTEPALGDGDQAADDVQSADDPAGRNSSVETADPLVGTRLDDRYQVVRRIGEGGMGIVYEAMHVLIEKRVAVKVLKDDFSSRADVVARFRQEAKSASRIGHEHIVDISDFGQTPGGQSYFVMEFLEGEDLASVLGREGTLAPDRAIRIALKCCRALGAAHAKGIVHRDMKPENVFLTRRDEDRDFVKVVDFGIAKMSEADGSPGKKLTKTGMIFGTPEYMSPEQASGKPLDHRVDVYAMGVILFEMLTGRVPFVGDTFMGILTQHLFEPPPGLHEANDTVRCPPALEEIIYRCLAKEADARFPSMDALVAALVDAEKQTPSGVGRMAGTMAGYARTRTPISKPPETVPPTRTGERPSAKALDGDSGTGAGSTAPPASTGLRVGLLALGGLLAVVGVGGFAVYLGAVAGRSATADPGDDPALNGEIDAAGLASGTPADGSEGPGGTPGEAPGASPASGSGDAPAGMDTPSPILVTITVVTDPPGARVRVPGRGQVCLSTPCRFDTTRGKAIVVEARGRGRVGRVDLVPVEAQTLEVPLRRRVASGGRSNDDDDGDPDDGQGAPPGGPSPDDLKTPDIFR